MSLVHPQQPRLLLGALLAGVFIANIDLAVVNVAAPSIHATLGASGAELQLVVSGYIISYAMLLIVSARLGTRFGFGRVYVGGVSVFTLASLVCGLAPNTMTLIVARIAQGVGGAMMVAQVLSGIQLSFTGQARVRAIGIYAIALSAGAVAGQIVGGLVVSANVLDLAWRPAFLINIPIGLALVVIALRVLPQHGQANSAAIDIRGVITLSTAVLLLIVPLIFGREMGWPGWTWISLALSGVTFGVFIAIERATSKPLVRLEIFTNPRVSGGLVAAAGSLSTYFAMLFVLALYLQQGLGRSPLFSGLALVSWVGAFGIAGPVLARTSRLHRVAVVGYLIMSGAYIALSASTLFGPATNDLVLMTLLGVGGLGFGIGRNATIADMTASAGSEFAADLSGLINSASQVAGAAGVAMFGTLYLAIAPSGGAVAAFGVVCAVLALTTLGATVAAWRAAAFAAEPRSLRAWQNATPPSASVRFSRSS